MASAAPIVTHERLIDLRLRRFAKIVAFLVVGVGVSVMIGWWANIPWLQGVAPGFASMKPNTAICFILCGTALFFQLRHSGPQKIVVSILACAVLAIAGITLSEYILNWNAGIDRLIFDQVITNEAVSYPGRMSIATATCFALLGVSLLTIGIRNIRVQAVSQWCAVCVLFLTALALIGYIYGAQALYSFGPYATVALHTAISNFLLSVAILVSQPNGYIMRDLTANAVGGAMARRFLPVAILLPLLLGWARIIGRSYGLYNMEMGIALLVLTNVSVFVVLILKYAHSANVIDGVRQHTENELLIYQERFQLAQRAAHVGTFDWDVNTLGASWSPELGLLYGITDGSFRGDDYKKWLNTYVHPDDRKSTEAAQMEAIQEGRDMNLEFRVVWPNGQIHWLSSIGRMFADEFGKPARMVGINMDITARKHAEEALMNAHAELEHRVQERTQQLADANINLKVEAAQRDNSNQRLSLQYAVTRILAESNELAEALSKVLAVVCTRLGWQLGVVWQRDPENHVLVCKDVWHIPAQQFPEFEKATWAKSFEIGIGLPGRVWSLGESIWVKDVVKDTNFPRAPFASQDGLHGGFAFPILVKGEVIGVIEIFNSEMLSPDEDLMQSMMAIGNQIGQFMVRKQAEDEIQNAIAIKEEFVSLVSHELRSPLSTIQGGIELVYDGTDGPLNTQQKKHLEMALRNSERLTRLINNVLDFQKMTSGHMEFHIHPQEVNTLVAESIDNFKEEAIKNGVALELELGRGLPKALCDKDAITQVVVNLVSNALKFSDHGKVTIKTETNEGVIKISVHDDGKGIREEDQVKLFKSFSQIRNPQDGSRRVGGTGLGLAISKKMVEANQGSIGVDSTYGQGSTFYLTLPTERK